MTHASRSGVASFVSQDEEECLATVRHLLSYLPSNNLEDPPSFATADDPARIDEGLTHLIPDSAREPYDLHEVIRRVVDDGDFFEVFPFWAMNVVIGFARLDGRAIGIVANQPKVQAGTLDIDSSEKASRFVRTCDAFNVPIVTFVDVPGFLPGRARPGVSSASSATGPSSCTRSRRRPSHGSPVITRKAYGGAYLVMNSKRLRADVSLRVAHGRDRRDGARRRAVTLQRTTGRHRGDVPAHADAFDGLPATAASSGSPDSLAKNEPSRQAALRLGYAYEGRFRHHLVTKGRNTGTRTGSR